MKGVGTPVAPTRLPVTVDPIANESLPSWTDRLAVASGQPRGHILERLGLIARLGEGARGRNVPGWGLKVSAETRQAIEDATGVPGERIDQMLVSYYDGGPINMSDLDLEDRSSITRVARREWYYSTGSNYCPHCLTDRHGAWRLEWKLPWAYVCTVHNVILRHTCPACETRAGTPRGDNSTRPNFLEHHPIPGECGNSLRFERGRGQEPCTHLLAGDPTVSVPSTGYAVAAQKVLQLGFSVKSDGGFWADLRALVTTFMEHATAENLDSLAAGYSVPDEFLLAVDAERAIREELLADNATRVELGSNARGGRRQRLYAEVPTNTELLTALIPAAYSLHTAIFVPANDAERNAGQASLEMLHAIVRTRGRELPALLAQRSASAALIEAAREAQVSQGRFTTRLASFHGEGASAVTAAHVPKLIWLDDWEQVANCFPTAREETGRKFTSIALVKALHDCTWEQAAGRLGYDTASIATLASNKVNEINTSGNTDTFHKHMVVMGERLAADPARTDYAARRARKTFPKTPKSLYEIADIAPTESRLLHATIWAWSQHTLSPTWEAPMWTRNGRHLTDNRKETYRRWSKHELPAVEPLLIGWLAERQLI